MVNSNPGPAVVPAGPRYVKAFVFVAGPDPRSPRLHGQHPLSDMRREEFVSPSLRITTFGSSTPTLPSSVGLDAAAWIKGRPFYLSDRPTLADTSDDGWPDVSDILRNLDGKFSLLLLRPDGALVCATDLIGAGPVYYCGIEHHLYVSSHLGLLLSALPSVPAYDHGGIAAQLIAAGPVAGSTPFQGIYRLPACNYLLVGTHHSAPPRLRVERYADPSTLLLRTAPSRSTTALIEEFDSLLQESLRRESYTGQVAVMLSGGYDSRAIALALRKDFALDFAAVSYGQPESLDVSGARAVATRLHVPHFVPVYDTWDLSTHAELLAALAGGAASLGGGQAVPGLELARERFGTVVVGYLGGTVSGQFLGPRGLKSPGELVEKTVRRPLRHDPAIQQYFGQEVQELTAALERQVSADSPLPLHQRAAVLDLTVASPAVSGAFDLAEIFVETSYPFFFRPLLQFGFNLPRRQLEGRQLYRSWHEMAESAVRRMLTKRDVSSRRDDDRVGMLQAPGQAETRPASVPLVDWLDLVERSAAWLWRAIEDTCDDARLRTLCQASLADTLKQRDWVRRGFMLGLPVSLVRAYAMHRRGE